MAIRVRKLAKQLRRDSGELLGILKAIGIHRIRSPEDMLSATIEKKLRTAIGRGVIPVKVEAVRVRKEEPVVESVESGIYQGVKRQVDERYQPLSQPVEKVLPVMNSPETPPQVERVPEVHPSERVAWGVERAAWKAERAALQAQLEAARAERDALQTTQSQHPLLMELFAERGLVGNDEAVRAVRALAESHRLDELLPSLVVTNRFEVQRWLRDVLVLVDGPAPEALVGEALVTVAKDRSEIPGAAEWRRLTAQLSEQLLLNGARRVVVVGGPIRARRLLHNSLDPRIELRFRPATVVPVVDAQADVTRTDAVALWQVQTSKEADEVYFSGRAMVVKIATPDLRGFIAEWIRSLRG